MSISTHVLDAVAGAPATGLEVALARVEPGAAGGATELWTGVTDADGRCPDLRESVDLAAGTYRIHFETGAWFAKAGRTAFYPVVEVTFDVTDPSSHHHVPLLLSPFAFSTYRGS